MSENNLLRHLRILKGYSKVEELAEIAAVSPGVIYRIERKEIITDECVAKVAKALEIKPDILYYNMGRIPIDKLELTKNDPLLFVDGVDKICKESLKKNKTLDFMKGIKNYITGNIDEQMGERPNE